MRTSKEWPEGYRHRGNSIDIRKITPAEMLVYFISKTSKTFYIIQASILKTERGEKNPSQNPKIELQIQVFWKNILNLNIWTVFSKANFPYYTDSFLYWSTIIRLFNTLDGSVENYK